MAKTEIETEIIEFLCDMYGQSKRRAFSRSLSRGDAQALAAAAYGFKAKDVPPQTLDSFLVMLAGLFNWKPSDDGR